MIHQKISILIKKGKDKMEKKLQIEVYKIEENKFKTIVTGNGTREEITKCLIALLKNTLNSIYMTIEEFLYLYPTYRIEDVTNEYDIES